MNWMELAKYFIFMYPGGSAFRVEQFLKIPDFTEVRNRIESPYLPYWFPNKFREVIIEHYDKVWV